MSRGNDPGQWLPSSWQRAVFDNAGAAYGFTRGEMLAHRRHGLRPRARMAAVWALKTRWPALSWTQIALIAARDHSTVIYNFRRAKDERERDGEFRALTDALVEGRPVALVPVAASVTEALLRTEPVRRIRERNDFGEDTWCAADLRRASGELLTALRREHPERCAA